MSGFIKLYREAFDHPLLQTGDRFRAWFWLVSKACWKDTKHDSRGKTIILKRGQFATTIRQLADELKWSKGAVERFLTRLENETMIETESGTGKTIITICNYSKYQDSGEDAGTESGTTTGTKAGQKRDTKEEGKELKEEKKGNYAFNGRTIRLSRADLERWRARYSNLTDIEAELGSLDDWISGEDEATRKKWFHIASGSLNKRHQAAAKSSDSDLMSGFVC